ncbi:ASFV G ACD 00190 [African swine fever virus]|nr:ASFV G ACD 00190 [African swine fever virus]
MFFFLILQRVILNGGLFIYLTKKLLTNLLLSLSLTYPVTIL